MKKIYFLILIQLHIYDIFAQESIPYPVVNDDCNACELWNHFRDSIFFNFSGGNLCCEKKNYIPVLIDEFEGTELDLNKWATHYCHTDYYNPNCLDTGYTKRIHKNNGAYFKDENVTVGNGICTLRTIKELTTFPTYCFKDQCVSKREYSSGMIMSRQWFQNFHRYEIRCKVVSGSGFWPAFWVFGWSNEIDIFEFINSSKPEFSIHNWWDNDHKYSMASEKQDHGNLDNDFHVYVVEHDKFFIKWFIDDKLVFKVSLFEDYLLLNYYLDKCNFPSGKYKKNRAYPYCNEPAMNVIANSGTDPNTEPPSNRIPNNMLIDYIRVYEIVYDKDSINDGCKLNITGPKIFCKQNDTLEYCIVGQYTDINNWILPEGVSMYQNPSLNITKRIVSDGVKDTIIFDTIINSSCIKVITDSSFKGGSIKYVVPKLCKFANDTIDYKIGFKVPTPEINYSLTSCSKVKVCINNLEFYDDIWWSDSGTKINESNCWNFDIRFSNKFDFYNIFLQASNKCGSTFKEIRINKNCNTNGNPNNIDDIFPYDVYPNPSAGYINVKRNTETSLNLIDGLVFQNNTGRLKSTFVFNNNEILYLDFSSYQDGDYTILVRGSDNNYYNKKFILSR